MSPDACIGDAVAAALTVHHRRRPLVVGLCGPQGSGKSTIAAKLAERFDQTAVLSLDDLYLLQGPNCEMVILEGWCVGARPQTELALARPCNLLEQVEDEEGVWRRAVNDTLVTCGALFDRIDFLVLLSPPSFDIVEAWRLEQEYAPRATRGNLFGVMDDEEVRRFIAHFEIITKHIQDDQSMNVNFILHMNVDHQAISIAERKIALTN